MILKIIFGYNKNNDNNGKYNYYPKVNTICLPIIVVSTQKWYYFKYTQKIYRYCFKSNLRHGINS